MLQLLGLALLLFLPAGTLWWWRAWVFIAIAAIGSAATMFVLRGDPELMNERMRWPVQESQAAADRLILPLFLASFFAVFVFIPLDAFRFRLLARPAAGASLIGLALVIASWWIVTAAMHQNSFAAPVVKHQPERHQHVIDGGLYAIVRHPMYSGGILFLPGLALWLQSYAAFLLAIVPAALLTVRIVFEERLLTRELKGYTAYCQKIRYRLVPFVW